MDVQFCLFNVALENWETAHMPPWKKAQKISLSPGIILQWWINFLISLTQNNLVI